MVFDYMAFPQAHDTGLIGTDITSKWPCSPRSIDEMFFNAFDMKRSEK